MDQATPAQTVGNQFVSQYYTVLHSSPKHLHRFYSDRSTLTYADVIPEGDSITQNLKTATGQKMIHETVMNLGYEDTMTEIYSVDSQYSKDGGVIVQVTGALQAKGKDKRPFVQTFFLAVQEKGYFVLNDIFRYLLPPGLISEILEEKEEGGEEIKTSAATTTGAASDEEEDIKHPTTSTSSTSPAVVMAKLSLHDTETPISPSEKEVHSTITSPSVDVNTTTTTTIKELKRQSSGPSAVPAAPGVSVPLSALVPGEVEGGTTGVNGVSIVYGAPPPSRTGVAAASGGGVGGGTSGPPSSSRQSSPEYNEDSTSPKDTGATSSTTSTTRRPPPPPPRQHDGSSAVSSIKSIDSPGPDSMEPPPTEGVFIRDIPQAVTLELLAEALTQYGPIVPGSLSLKTQQNRDSYAFVDYQNAEDAAECLAHGMEFFGRKVTVETKRPHIFRPSGGGGAMRHGMHTMSNNGLGIPGSGGGVSMHQMQQYSSSPMHHQQHQYQQYQRADQHNVRVVANGGNVGLPAGATGGYGANTRHMSNGRASGGGGVGNASMQGYPRNAMSLQNAAAYSMAGYPMMMYNPAMAGMPGMTYVQMQPGHQTAAMMMDASGGVGVGGVVGVDAGYAAAAAAASLGSRGGRGGGVNVGGNPRYDSTGGRGGGGGTGGGGSVRSGSRNSSTDQQHSPYARASVGQPMPY